MLFSKKFLPAKAKILKLLLERPPCVAVPAQAILYRIAILQQRFFDFFAHLAGGRRTQGCHLAIPPAGQSFAQVLETRTPASSLKMFSQARVCLIDLRRLDELAPRSVREQRDRTEFAAILQM